ncbi:MAG: DUF3570 domain-containing protein, partial [Stenotrophobium sp.]
MSAQKKPGATLLALTASVLCLPGYSGDAQAWADSEAQTGYRFSAYRESPLPADKTNGLNGERYSVDSHQFRVLWPSSKSLDFTADMTFETMSGASPWFIVPDAGGKPIQVMSGATIWDRRAALQLNTRHYDEASRETLSVSVSKERDYLSLNGGLEGAWDFNERLTTLSAGAGYSYDELRPTDGESTRFPMRIASASKNTATVYAGLSQVLGPQTVVQWGLSYNFENGYLSDPYKQAYVAGNILPDHRPDRRNEYAATMKLRHYFQDIGAAVHVDYRYYRDSWRIAASTLELSWHQNLPAQWQLVPAVRYYSQAYAGFYQPYYTAARGDGDYSSDYRLSAYGALSLRLGLMTDWRQWSFSLNGERYRSSGSYAIRSVNMDNPGLVNFTVISAALG